MALLARQSPRHVLWVQCAMLQRISASQFVLLDQWPRLKNPFPVRYPLSRDGGRCLPVFTRVQASDTQHDIQLGHRFKCAD
jgi:hypothetical protein